VKRSQGRLRAGYRAAKRVEFRGADLNDCLDFGIDLGSPVGIEYYDQAPFKFNGKIEGARVEYLGSPAQVQEEKLQTDGPIPAED
jgi:hypothetical protein